MQSSHLSANRTNPQLLSRHRLPSLLRSPAHPNRPCRASVRAPTLSSRRRSTARDALPNRDRDKESRCSQTRRTSMRHPPHTPLRRLGATKVCNRCQHSPNTPPIALPLLLESQQDKRAWVPSDELHSLHNLEDVVGAILSNEF